VNRTLGAILCIVAIATGAYAARIIFAGLGSHDPDWVYSDIAKAEKLRCLARNEGQRALVPDGLTLEEFCRRAGLVRMREAYDRDRKTR
jgi:hypothetical protein